MVNGGETFPLEFEYTPRFGEDGKDDGTMHVWCGAKKQEVNIRKFRYLICVGGAEVCNITII